MQTILEDVEEWRTDTTTCVKTIKYTNTTLMIFQPIPYGSIADVPVH
jgi:hypothetical protein